MAGRGERASSQNSPEGKTAIGQDLNGSTRVKLRNACKLKNELRSMSKILEACFALKSL